jgi:hypothetical protein
MQTRAEYGHTRSWLQTEITITVALPGHLKKRTKYEVVGLQEKINAHSKVLQREGLA